MQFPLQIEVPPFVKEICRRLQAAGFKAYVVGGAVRDRLMGLCASCDGEWDVATSARPEEVMRIFPRTVPTGVAHGTVTVLEGEGKCEVTTFRHDKGYSDARHPDEVTFLNDVREDLARRDFTVNAIALDPLSGEIVDPTGGMQDLKVKLLRAVGNPAERFREDGLRPLRAARFAAVLEFRIEQATFDALEGALPSFMMVSAERKRDEIIKMMKATRPSLGWEVLRKAKYLRALFPEMERLLGLRQGGLHRYDGWNHSIMAADFCAGEWQVKLAALLHDIGKPFAAAAEAERKQPAQNEGKMEAKGREGDEKQQENDDEQLIFYRHEEIGAGIVERWMERMKFSKEDTKRVVGLVRQHMVLYNPNWTDAAVRRFIRRVGEENIDPLMQVVEADIKARGVIGNSLSLLKELKSRVYDQLRKEVPFSLKDLAVDGRDIIQHLQIDSGPMVGKILKQLLERVLENPALNRREVLLRLAEEIKSDLN